MITETDAFVNCGADTDHHFRRETSLAFREAFQFFQVSIFASRHTAGTRREVTRPTVMAKSVLLRPTCEHGISREVHWTSAEGSRESASVEESQRKNVISEV